MTGCYYSHGQLLLDTCVCIIRTARIETCWQRSSVAEQGTHKPLVGGSNPPAATFFTFNYANILSVNLVVLKDVDKVLVSKK